MKKILIVDDNEQLTAYLGKKLAAAGYEVAIASTGLSAIDRIAQYTPDIIFVDYFLPNINGDKLCQIIRRMEHLNQSYLVLMSAAAKEMELDPAQTFADTLIAKGTFKETVQYFFSVLATAERPRSDKSLEGIIGIDSIRPRRMTRELVEKNRHLQTILDSISEGILEIYRGQVVYANPAAVTILDRPQEHLLTTQPTALFPESEQSKIESLMESENQTHLIVSQEGPVQFENKIVSLRKFPLQGDPDTIILLITDITEQIQTEKALHNYRVHLETIIEERTADLKQALDKLHHTQKMEAIGVLAGGVAHDLNNILNPIVVYPELLLLDLPADSPLKPIILAIKESAEKAAAVVQDLLTTARRGVKANEVVNINSIISDYLKSPEYKKLKSYHPEVVIETHLEEDLLNVLGSPVQLGKMIMNLVSNATEAMPRGGKVLLSTETHYIDRNTKIMNGSEEVKEGEYVILTVSDEGVGIFPEDIKKIFDPFYTKKIMGRSGTGLGMTVVWGTVVDHNGSIDVQSVPGEGSSFILYLPVTRQEPISKKSSIPIEEFKGNGESILVVDDVKEQRAMASRALTTFGFSVSTVASGEEAVEFIKHNQVDLIILDMIMDPGIDGIETYRRIREIRPDQRVIIASGYSEVDMVAQCLSLGVGHYIKKPYTIEKIGLAVRQELDKSPS